MIIEVMVIDDEKVENFDFFQYLTILKILVKICSFGTFRPKYPDFETFVKIYWLNIKHFLWKKYNISIFWSSIEIT